MGKSERRDWRDVSRTRWNCTQDWDLIEPEELFKIVNAGSLMRIADAVEAIARNAPYCAQNHDRLLKSLFKARARVAELKVLLHKRNAPKRAVGGKIPGGRARARHSR